jgi:hypothetical protein
MVPFGSVERSGLSSRLYRLRIGVRKAVASVEIQFRYNDSEFLLQPLGDASSMTPNIEWFPAKQNRIVPKFSEHLRWIKSLEDLIVILVKSRECRQRQASRGFVQESTLRTPRLIATALGWCAPALKLAVFICSTSPL